jgi:hypothetical protein
LFLRLLKLVRLQSTDPQESLHLCPEPRLRFQKDPAAEWLAWQHPKSDFPATRVEGRRSLQEWLKEKQRKGYASSIDPPASMGGSAFHANFPTFFL